MICDGGRKRWWKGEEEEEGKEGEGREKEMEKKMKTQNRSRKDQVGETKVEKAHGEEDLKKCLYLVLLLLLRR